jgi:hypothetical protein
LDRSSFSDKSEGEKRRGGKKGGSGERRGRAGLTVKYYTLYPPPRHVQAEKDGKERNTGRAWWSLVVIVKV